jgi:hypothetical protein
MMNDTRSELGEYRLLHKYLRDRFADRVVLTFAEIEDLLGFPLPPAARLQADWWGVTEGTKMRSVQVEAWHSAHRTATVNMGGQRVLFEREWSVDA